MIAADSTLSSTMICANESPRSSRNSVCTGAANDSPQKNRYAVRRVSGERTLPEVGGGRGKMKHGRPPYG